MIGHFFEIQFAGLWSLVWQFGIGGVLILACGAGWYFSPIHRVDFIYAAVIIAAVMASTANGVRLGEKRVHSQWDASIAASFDATKEARAGAVRDVARKPSRWLPNKRDPDQRD